MFCHSSDPSTIAPSHPERGLQPESKDPWPACTTFGAARHSHHTGQNALTSFWSHPQVRGPSTPLGFASRTQVSLRMTASFQDHRFLIDSPANAISAPHFSARSCQRGFTDSISAIFLDLRQPFNCFSLLIAFSTSSNPSQYTSRLQWYSRAKTFEFTALVLAHAAFKIVAHSDVECSAYAGNDINPIFVFHLL